ncbi:MAG: response regulator [bacterium]|nr:response regulator [bacterium]
MTKILIVDDVEGWRNYHKQIMEELFELPEIQTASSAKEGYDKLLQNNNSPFDIILTDLQMETDFEPKYAGEWFVEQIKTFSKYYRTKVVIISATSNISHIAENLGVDYIPKNRAINFPECYNIVTN